MNPAINALYAEYLDHTGGDKAAAASLTLADVMSHGTDPSPTTYSIAQAANRLNLSTSTLYNLCQQGKIGHHRFGRNIRFTSKDMDKYTKDTAVTVTLNPFDELRL